MELRLTAEEKGACDMDSTVEKREAMPQITEENFDHTVKYPDEYYDEFIRNFVPNKKKRLLYRFI